MDPADKILYTGYDVKGKKQYFYKQFWNDAREREKFCHMIEFGRQMPGLRQDIEKQLNKKEWDTEKSIALQLKIITMCNFRVGNLIDGENTKSTGISTLKNVHVKINKKTDIKFIGKSGIENQCTIEDKKVISLLKELKEGGKNGDYLFTDDKKNRISSCKVNGYLKKFGNFTSKNFRTWVANTAFIREMLKLETAPSSEKEKKTAVKDAVKSVAQQLHHTPAICKKKYIYPELIETFMKDPGIFMQRLRSKTDSNKNADLREEERAFIAFLQKDCIKRGGCINL
jgi:DNA topoisomerase-1